MLGTGETAKQNSEQTPRLTPGRVRVRVKKRNTLFVTSTQVWHGLEKSSSSSDAMTTIAVKLIPAASYHCLQRLTYCYVYRRICVLDSVI